jgi:hypothetical protein
LRFKTLAFVVSLAAGSALHADPGASWPAVGDIVNRYVTASEAQQENLRGMSMQVEIDASLPKLKKRGTMQAWRYISRLGEITYRAVRFDGDSTVKKDVIARYLAAEIAAREGGRTMAVTPANYRFKYKAALEQNGVKVHILAVTPRKKRVGLFKGEIWVDAATYLPVRESGTFVRNPSVFLKKVEFVREYEIRYGVSLPKRIESRIETRLVGRAEMRINFSNFAKGTAEQAQAAPVGEVQ